MPSVCTEIIKARISFLYAEEVQRFESTGMTIAEPSIDGHPGLAALYGNSPFC